MGCNNWSADHDCRVLRNEFHAHAGVAVGMELPNRYWPYNWYLFISIHAFQKVRMVVEQHSGLLVRDPHRKAYFMSPIAGLKRFRSWNLTVEMKGPGLIAGDNRCSPSVSITMRTRTFGKHSSEQICVPKSLGRNLWSKNLITLY